MDFRRMNQCITKSEGLVEMDFRTMNQYITMIIFFIYLFPEFKVHGLVKPNPEILWEMKVL